MASADLPAVELLERQLFGEEAWSRRLLATELASLPGRTYLVAEDAGEVAGYGGLFVTGGQAEVLTLAVARQRWGQGVGSLLLDALLAAARQHGCSEVFLEVRADNDRAQRLYLHRGFTRIGLRRGYYQPSGTDAVVMRLDLAARLGQPGGAPAREAIQ
ncbi:MAG: ribosomal protein S18-alanine N-acetyltransferase [Actinobacteria bacterium]|nr:ribosomal protein S18-alanine N-acetyltransferase [Actinomycetota bacterium]